MQSSRTQSEAIQRRAHLPRPASSFAAICLFITWIVLSLIVGSVLAADPALESPVAIWWAVALRVSLAAVGLIAILRGRANPWGYYIGGACLISLTVLPCARLIFILARPHGQEDAVVQGTLSLAPLLAGLCTSVPFLFSSLSRFFYRVRRSRLRER